MAKFDPYLIFPGTCEEAFNLYRSVFGGTFDTLSRFGEMPPREGVTLSKEQQNMVMHVALHLGGDTLLLGSDSGGELSPPVEPGNNFSVSVNAASKEEADRYFQGLSQGGRVTQAMELTFWGSYFGMCTDRFGISWMISHSVPPESGNI
ncbi:MAG: VOC family protein [Bacteroidales bacterium]